MISALPQITAENSLCGYETSRNYRKKDNRRLFMRRYPVCEKKRNKKIQHLQDVGRLRIIADFLPLKGEYKHCAFIAQVFYSSPFG